MSIIRCDRCGRSQDTDWYEVCITVIKDKHIYNVGECCMTEKELANYNEGIDWYEFEVNEELKRRKST